MIQINTIPNFQNQIRSLEQKIQGLENRNETLTKISTDLQSFQSLIGQNNVLQEQIKNLQQDSQKKSNEKDQQITQLSLNLQQIQSDLKTCQKNGADKEALLSQCNQGQINLQTMQSKLMDLGTQLNSRDQVILGLQGKINENSTLLGSFQVCNSEKKELNSRINELQNSLNNMIVNKNASDVLASQVPNLNERIKGLNDQVGFLKAKEDQLIKAQQQFAALSFQYE